MAGDRPRRRRRLQADRRPGGAAAASLSRSGSAAGRRSPGSLAFLWLELVYGQSGFQAVGLTPRTVAIATLVYSACTFAAWRCSGSRRGSTAARPSRSTSGCSRSLAPLEVREGRLGLRRPLSGAIGWVGVTPGSVALVLVTIGGTAFDGAQEGAAPGADPSTFDWLVDLGLGPMASLRLDEHALLRADARRSSTAIFWAGICGMHTVRGSPPLASSARLFAHAFIPIALAYLVAHYFSLVVFQEQAQFTYLLSDPLGDGSDYFGTAVERDRLRLIGATAIWYVQVGALVVGHVLALALGHDRALARLRRPRTAARSQYWMLALMVGFTSLGLFLLSQANQ